MSIEPRPTERNPSSDGFSFTVMGSGGGVENGLRSMTRLPMGEVSPVKR